MTTPTTTAPNPVPNPIPSLMIDVAGTALDAEDQQLLANPHVAGVILFGRNVQTPEQVRALTDSMRVVNERLVIAVDQEGGRVARLRAGFSPLPAMGRLGVLYEQDAEQALALAQDVGYLMACEVLAVGIDVSFAPVLDIDAGSLVIGDRAFHQTPAVASALSAQFMAGMNMAGMSATGKHFPGHGSVIPDSHVADACDERCFDEIWATDTQVFVDNLSALSALMPAHVVFSQVDDKPAGFSQVWLQDIIRGHLGFDGVLFSDDLSMKAAHVAGGAVERVASAIGAGCDVALVCNDRDGAKTALASADSLPRLDCYRLGRMKADIPAWQGTLEATCAAAFADWQAVRARVGQAFFAADKAADKTPDSANPDSAAPDPTAYTNAPSL